MRFGCDSKNFSAHAISYFARRCLVFAQIEERAAVGERTDARRVVIIAWRACSKALIHKASPETLQGGSVVKRAASWFKIYARSV